MSVGAKTITFLKEARIELKKVVWPSRKEATKLTVIVIAVSIVTAVFFGMLDLFFSWGLEKIIEL